MSRTPILHPAKYFGPPSTRRSHAALPFVTGLILAKSENPNISGDGNR
jgi:hypothetical protein